jgi:hypothetical protein
VKVDGIWYDGWGQCPEVKGRNVRIECREKGQFRDIQTIAVIDGETTEQVYERPPKPTGNRMTSRYPVVFEEYDIEDPDARRRRVALEAAARHGAAWGPEEVLRRAKEFEDWLAGGPTPPQPRPRDEHPDPYLW